MTAESQFSLQSNLTIPQAFEQSARSFADRTALIADGGRGEKYSYAEAAQVVRGWGTVLLQERYARVREVGLLSENRPEWALAYLAVLYAGKTVVPLDINLSSTEINALLNRSDLQVVFCSVKCEKLLSTCESRVERLLLDKIPRIDEASEQMEPTAQIANNQTAALIYTSGTTGSPKAVELTHRNILSNVQGAGEVLRFDERDVFLSVLPLHHTFEATCGFLTPLLSGACVVYARSLKSRYIIEDIRSNQATVMCGVPLLFEKMYQSMQRAVSSASLYRRILFQLLVVLAATGWQFGWRWGRVLFRALRRKAGLASMRMFVSGGAAIPPKVSKFFNLIGFEFLQGYGMTECSPVLSVNRPADTRFDSVGPPLPNVRIRIDQPDGGGIGEIVVKGPNVTPGYRGNAEATAELIQDGWLHTGDLGKLDDGHLWITGRAKNLIVSAAGKNIYPEEIEEALVASDYILEAVVFGKTKAQRQGEEVCAVVVPDMEQFHSGHDRPDKELVKAVISREIERINGRIAGFKRISSYEVRFEELEKTSTRKIKRYLYS